MKKIKLYFAPLISDDFAYSLERIKEDMIFFGIKKTQAFEAVREYSSEHFWCKQYGAIGVRGDGCGKECKYYSPKNGKNGCCKNVGNLYSKGKEITIQI